MVAHIDSKMLGINQVQANDVTTSSGNSNKHRDRRIRRSQLKYSNRYSPLRRQSHIVQHANNKSDKNKTRRAYWKVRDINRYSEFQSNRNAIEYRNYRISDSPVEKRSCKNLFGATVQRPLRMEYKNSLRNEFTPLKNRWSMPSNSNDVIQNRHVDANNNDFNNDDNIFDTNMTLVPESYSMIPNLDESFPDSYTKFTENLLASSTLILDDTMEKERNPLKR